MFWVISVYFNIRNTPPKSGTFLLGHTVYIVYMYMCVCVCIYIYIYIYIGRHVLNQLHFDIARKYLSLFMEPPYRSNKTGCYRLVQITWYSGANESFPKLFWRTIDFKNDCIRHTLPSLCPYSYVWIYFNGEFAIVPEFTLDFLLCTFSTNGVQWENYGGFKL